MEVGEVARQRRNSPMRRYHAPGKQGI